MTGREAEEEKRAPSLSAAPDDEKKKIATDVLDNEAKADVEAGAVLRPAGPPDADEAFQVLAAGHAGEVVTMTPEEERRLLRKIDLHLMPLLCIVYGLNYLDKTTVSYASVMGLKADIHLVGMRCRRRFPPPPPPPRRRCRSRQKDGG